MFGNMNDEGGKEHGAWGTGQRAESEELRLGENGNI